MFGYNLFEVALKGKCIRQNRELWTYGRQKAKPTNPIHTPCSRNEQDGSRSQSRGPQPPRLHHRMGSFTVHCPSGHPFSKTGSIPTQHIQRCTQHQFSPNARDIASCSDAQATNCGDQLEICPFIQETYWNECAAGRSIRRSRYHRPS